jgi:hypothetical protein
MNVGQTGVIEFTRNRVGGGEGGGPNLGGGVPIWGGGVQTFAAPDPT